MASADLDIRLATMHDLEELSTVHTRSFHPVSPYMRRAFPNTQGMRDWWKQVHRYAIMDPELTLMVVTSKSSNGAIVAMARWRYYPKLPHQAIALGGPEADFAKPDGDLSAGSWTLFKTCPDIEIELYDAMMVFMAETHTKYMGDRPHYLIELVGTVHEAQGTGAGRLLLQEINRRADEVGIETFVETNNIVVKFYEKMGYKILERLIMPGGLHGEIPLASLSIKKRTEFGFVKVHHDFKHDKIIGTLDHISLDSLYSHCALSYTWGPQDMTKQMEINGKRLAITSNLTTGLRSKTVLAVSSHCKFNWIDAICINQEVAEARAQQVPRTRKIYGRADHILGFVRPAEFTGAAIDLLGEIRNRTDTLNDVVW